MGLKLRVNDVSFEVFMAVEKDLVSMEGLRRISVRVRITSPGLLVEKDLIGKEGLRLILVFFQNLPCTS